MMITVRYIDDGKGRYQSHEAHVEIVVDGAMPLDFTTYGDSRADVEREAKEIARRLAVALLAFAE
jgi:hypothetical protein